MVGSIIDGKKQTTTSQRMTGSMKHTQFDAPKTVLFTSLKGLVSDGWLRK
jgi:hypothetical protein